MNKNEVDACAKMLTRFNNLSIDRKLNIIFQITSISIISVDPKKMISHINNMIIEESSRLQK